MTTNPRKTPGYTAWVKKVLKHCDPVCIRCGYPVDMTLAPRTPRAPRPTTNRRSSRQGTPRHPSTAQA